MFPHKVRPVHEEVRRELFLQSRKSTRRLFTHALARFNIGEVYIVEGDMRIQVVPLNSDNYGYVVSDAATKQIAFVDISGQHDKMLSVWEHDYPGYNLVAVFTTHKHADHAGGNSFVAYKVPGLPVYGGVIDNVEACTRFVNDGDELKFGSNISVKCIHTPGHTMGHISYYFTDDAARVVFTGDTLFVGGAGKFFEGTGSDMYPSLYEKLARLPGDTLVYCGHEYTLSNYRFALSVDPDNQQLIEANRKAQMLRDEGKYTVPSTIQQELETNPFLRVHEAAIRERFPGIEDPHELLAAVRKAKDEFH
jgi:hydroxyacylglutathione hydrolase